MAKKKTTEKKWVWRIVLAGLATLLLASGLKVYEDVFASNVKPEAKDGVLYYYTHLSFDENFKRIQSQQVLRNPEALKRIIKITGYDQMLKPGRYRLTATTSNLQLLRLLVSGQQEAVNVVLKYAERKHDLAVFWSKQIEADSFEIESMLNSSILGDSLGLDSAEVIMAFVPNTYNFYWTTSSHQLAHRMMKEFRLFWDSSRLAKAAHLNLTIGEVGTLASIVQKETNKVDEMPVVAGVYYNRLNKHMPLQADPTIIYALNNKSIKRVGGAMLKVASPYNTYVNKGLPPGPICLPSVQAIDAVLNLKHHGYLYFCASPDFSGYHQFASTFDAHMVNARKYQQALNKKGIQ